MLILQLIDIDYRCAMVDLCQSIMKYGIYIGKKVMINIIFFLKFVFKGSDIDILNGKVVILH